MRAGERLALAIVVCLVLLVGGAAGAATYAWRSAGTVHIEIHADGPDGTEVSIHAPGLLVDAAIALVPVPDLLDDPETVAAVAAVQSVAEELARMPDAVLVDIREAESRVKIEKIDGHLSIRVRDRGERVDIDVPIGSVRKLAAKLGRVARAAA